MKRKERLRWLWVQLVTSGCIMMLPQEGTKIGVCKDACSHTHTGMYILFS